VWTRSSTGDHSFSRYSVGLLEQEPQLDNTKTVKQIVEEGVQPVVALLNEFNRISEKFAEPCPTMKMNKLIERQGEVQEKIDAMNAWDLDSGSKWPWMLFGARLGRHRSRSSPEGKTPRRPVPAPAQQPDILLLDEPTNHLDAESVAWMEHHLQNYPGTVIAVTTTATFWTMWRSGSWSWIGGRHPLEGQLFLLAGTETYPAPPGRKKREQKAEDPAARTGVDTHES